MTLRNNTGELSAYANEFAPLPNKTAPHESAGFCDPVRTIPEPVCF